MSKRQSPSKRTRTTRPYPNVALSEVLPLATAIHQFASGGKVKRETLLRQMKRSASSSATRALITNSGKYGLTLGGYLAEYLELTDVGRRASAPDVSEGERQTARFELAIAGIEPFARLYREFSGRKLPSRDVMKDALEDGRFGITDLQECVDIFVVNAKELGLLSEIGGAETLVSWTQEAVMTGAATVDEANVISPATVEASRDWKKICFYVTPIGAEASEERRHADLFLSHLVEPALAGFGLTVIRADRIGDAGMITSQIVEHLLRARLVVVDMSFHNPNVFYEMAVRHASRLPVVQITRKANPLPFDVNQVRTVVVDTTDIYSLVPRLQTYQSEIAAQVRAALATDGEVANPLSLFYPNFEVTIRS